MDLNRVKSDSIKTVVDYNIRSTTCSSVNNILEFILSQLNSTIIFGYLAVFDEESVSPKMRIVVISLIMVRVMMCFVASFCVYIGLKRELVKILV